MLLLSILTSDYPQFGKRCPRVASRKITAFADTCALSHPWALDDFSVFGYNEDHLIPVSVDLEAANKSPITIEGAARVHLKGVSPDGSKSSCATMVYISWQAREFHLSLKTLIDLGIIPIDFPTIGTSQPSTKLPVDPSRPTPNARLSAKATTPPENVHALFEYQYQRCLASYPINAYLTTTTA